MEQLVLIIHVFVALAVIGLVLLQKGKGAGMGAAFGAGASQTVFGSKGSGSFLLKLTMGLAAIFFITSISLTYMTAKSTRTSQTTGLLKSVQQYSQLAHEQETLKQKAVAATTPAAQPKTQQKAKSLPEKKG